MQPPSSPNQSPKPPDTSQPAKLGTKVMSRARHEECSARFVQVNMCLDSPFPRRHYGDVKPARNQGWLNHLDPLEHWKTSSNVQLGLLGMEEKEGLLSLLETAAGQYKQNGGESSIVMVRKMLKLARTRVSPAQPAGKISCYRCAEQWLSVVHFL